MSTATRTDIHRPSAVDPTRYDYMTSIDLSDSGPRNTAEDPHRNARWVEQRKALEAKLSAGSPHGNYSQCAHCGAHLRYVAVMGYIADDGKVNGTLVGWGHDCLETLGMLDSAAEANLRQLQLARQRRETAKVNERIREQFKADEPELYDFMQQAVDNPGDNLPFVVDVSSKFFGPYPQLTERQVAAMRKCMVGRQKFLARKAEREAERAELAKTAQPVPTDGKRIKIVGQVLSIDLRQNDFGTRMVMRVRDHDRGFEVWGTAPSAIRDTLALEANEQGRFDEPVHVEFMAKVVQARDNRYFGFFSNPTKAKVLGRVDVERSGNKACVTCDKGVSIDQRALTAEGVQCLDCADLEF